MNALKHLLIAALLLSMQACVTTYELQSNCMTQDWFATGFDAAKRGRIDQIAWNNAITDCTKQSMWVDREAYDHGYSLGLKSFCTELNGFEFGQRNLRYSKICPSEEQELFDIAYQDGEDLYSANQDVEYCENKLSQEKSDIVYARERREKLAYLIDHTDLDKDTAKEYVKERYSLKQSLYGAESRLSALRSALRESQRRQAKLEFGLFEDYYESDAAQGAEFSLDESVTRENIVVSQPAIIVYRPLQMSDELKKHFDKTTKEINKFVAETNGGRFRYQMVGPMEIKFTNAKSKVINTGVRYSEPTLLFYDGKQDPTAEVYQGKLTEELVSMVGQFINSH